MNKFFGIYKCTIKEIDGVNHFFVTFTDINNHTHTIEVESDIFQEFEAFRRDDDRQDISYRRHIEHLDLSEEEIHTKSFQSADSTDEEAINNQIIIMLCESILRLPKSQRKRLLLHYEYEMSFKEIAKLEKCSISAIQQSITRAKEKILDELKDIFEEI